MKYITVYRQMTISKQKLETISLLTITPRKIPLRIHLNSNLKLAVIWFLVILSV